MKETGIYSYDHLRDICPCAECAASFAAGVAYRSRKIAIVEDEAELASLIDYNLSRRAIRFRF